MWIVSKFELIYKGLLYVIRAKELSNFRIKHLPRSLIR